VIVSVHDVTGYILDDRTMTGLKLQKLLYYSQAWSLVWDGVALFEEPQKTPERSFGSS